jgi:lycopene beta-cyclase
MSEIMSVFDAIFVGGGLANCLAFYFAKKLHPEKKLLLVERGQRLGGARTWSFHANEITAAANGADVDPAEVFRLLSPLISQQWSDYEVRFPRFSKVVPLGYACIRSSRMHEVIAQQYPNDVMLGQSAEIMGADSIQLGERRMFARVVIDGRGAVTAESPRTAFQKFYGLFLKWSGPNFPKRPVLMDATVEQSDGFSFVYVLPFDQETVLVEDTHFSSSPLLDPEKSRRFLLTYIKAMGSTSFDLIEDESGCLPIPLLGSVRNNVTTPGWPVVGYRAGLFNAATGYSFSHALRTAVWLSFTWSNLTAEQLTRRLNAYSDTVGGKGGFYRRINNMMIHAANSEQRREIFSRFYSKLPFETISRFYSGDLSVGDKLQILQLKPPLNWIKAAKAFSLPGPDRPQMLIHRSQELL